MLVEYWRALVTLTEANVSREKCHITYYENNVIGDTDWIESDCDDGFNGVYRYFTTEEKAKCAIVEYLSGLMSRMTGYKDRFITTHG